MDFSSNMNDGESIVLLSSEIAVYNQTTESDVTDVMVVSNSLEIIDNTKMKVSIQGGDIDNVYCLSFRAYISDNKKLEEDIKFRVKDC
jgi:endo-beta-N-acetylglucosaminidase D